MLLNLTMLSLTISSLLLLAFSYKTLAESRTNFEIKSFKLCNNTQGLFKFQGNFTKESGINYLTARIIFTIPLDENVGAICRIETLVLNNYVELFTMREKYLCKAANVYGGELWYDIQRAAQVIPKYCPISQGRYELHHAEVDFNKLSLQTFPFGYMKFTLKGVDNKHPQNNLFCFETEVFNMPN